MFQNNPVVDEGSADDIAVPLMEREELAGAREAQTGVSISHKGRVNLRRINELLNDSLKLHDKRKRAAPKGDLLGP